MAPTIHSSFLKYLPTIALYLFKELPPTSAENAHAVVHEDWKHNQNEVQNCLGKLYSHLNYPTINFAIKQFKSKV